MTNELIDQTVPNSTTAEAAPADTDTAINAQAAPAQPDHFLDMARSATNGIGNSVATAVVSKWEGQLRTEDQVAADLDNATEPTPPHHGIG